MIAMLKILSGVPIPPVARGRKKGSRDVNHDARQAAIAKGVALMVSGCSGVEAAKIVHPDYPSMSIGRMVRLIRQARKDNHQG